MRRLFADTVYWIALANRKDQWHAKVVQTMRSLGQVSLVTTDEVLDEFLGACLVIRVPAILANDQSVQAWSNWPQ